MDFHSKKCFKNHKRVGGKRKVSTCDQYHRCPKCGKTYRLKDYADPLGKNPKNMLIKHDCEEVNCMVCYGVYPSNHICYVRPVPIEEPSEEVNTIEDELCEAEESLEVDDMIDQDVDDDDLEKDEDEEKTTESNVKFLFFDFESQFIDSQHVPNLAVAEWRCEVCLQNEKEGKERYTEYEMIDPEEAEKQKISIKYPRTKCRCSANRQKVFSGPDTKTDFCNWLFSDHHPSVAKYIVETSWNLRQSQYFHQTDFWVTPNNPSRL